MCVACGCGKKKGEPGFGKGKASAAKSCTNGKCGTCKSCKGGKDKKAGKGKMPPELLNKFAKKKK